MIGTEATVASGAYERAVRAVGLDVELRSVACPAFVDHVERGDTSSAELHEAARRYLVPLVEAGVDTLILGCTHYPMLSGLIQLVMGGDVVLVSSAEETAKEVWGTLVSSDLLREEDGEPSHEFLTTGDPNMFEAIAHRFLGPALGGVESVVVKPVEVGA
jgi:glutamate racemase